MNDPVSTVVTEFLLDREARGHSPNTLRAYRHALTPFTQWLAEHQAPLLTDVTPALLRDYALACSALLSPGGAHARLRPVKTLLKWAHEEELIGRDLTRRLPMPRLKRDPLPCVRLTDFQGLVTAAQSHSRTPLRDTALLMVLFDTGLRASEVLALHLSDVRPEGALTVRQGKGGKSRAVPMDRKTLKAIRTYVQRERRGEHTPVLFLAQDHGLTRGALDKILERLCKAADLPRFSAHAFRRGCAVQYLRNEGDVFTLQRILGHTSLEMTNRYAQLLDEDVKQAHLRASPVRKSR